MGMKISQRSFKYDRKIVVWYVDDLLVIVKNLNYFEQLKRCLQERLTVKDFGGLRYFSSTKMSWGHDQVSTQRQCSLIDTLFEENFMKAANPSSVLWTDVKISISSLGRLLKKKLCPTGALSIVCCTSLWTQPSTTGWQETHLLLTLMIPRRINGWARHASCNI